MRDAISPPIVTTVTRTDLACLLCSRVPGYVQADVLYLAAGADPALVRRRRCTWCGGRLVTGETTTRTLTRPLTEEERRRNSQGRRPASMTPPCSPALCLRPGPGGGACSTCRTHRSRQNETKPSCLDCAAPVNRGYLRCRPCGRAHQRATSRVTRLVDVLSDGRPRSGDDLLEALGIERAILHYLVPAARKRGHAIVVSRQGRQNGVYVLCREESAS